MLFILSSKLFWFSRYLSFCHDFLVMQEKPLDQKDKVNCKIHDVTIWLTNNFNTYFAQYLKKQSQPDNQTRSINGIQQQEHFSPKNIRKMKQRDQFKTSFYFLSLISGKRKWFAAQFQYVSIALNLACNENKQYKTLGH